MFSLTPPLFQWVQVPPGETLQPEATGAAMEVTVIIWRKSLRAPALALAAKTTDSNSWHIRADRVVGRTSEMLE
jgi:hypothetical protein